MCADPAAAGSLPVAAQPDLTVAEESPVDGQALDRIEIGLDGERDIALGRDRGRAGQLESSDVFRCQGAGAGGQAGYEQDGKEPA